MNPSPRFLSLLGALALVACSHSQPVPEVSAASPQTSAQAAPAAVPEEPVPTLKLPIDVRPTHYALHLTVDPTQGTFGGSADVDVTLEKARQVLWLNGRDLQVSKAWVEANGQRQTATYRQVDPVGVARLDLPAAVGPGKATLHLEWTRPYETRAVGLYKTTEANLAYIATQFEAVDARRAFPSFDQPEFKTPFDVTLTVPADDAAISNGPELSTTSAGHGQKVVTFQTTKPLPTYLVAVAVGPFDVVQGPTLPPNKLRPYPLPTRGIAPKGRGAELAWALEAGAHIVETEERYFQIAYPYPKLDHLALPDFAYGAMENAGAITYREQLLLFRPGVSSPADKFEIASTMAHETAHQWFGDLVTMPFWTDAWLNESFATWMAARNLLEWAPKLGPIREELLGDVSGAMHNDALSTARAIRQPLTRIDDVWDQFDGLTYEKGAAVLGMFERWVGPEKFRQGIHDYLIAHAWGSGNTDDLLAAISRASGQNVAPAFHSFLDQSGVPQVGVKVACDASGARFELSQKPFVPLGVEPPKDRLWGIPVCIRYATGATERETCQLLAQPAQTVRVESCPSWVFPNADSVGYYRWSLDAKSLGELQGKALAKLSPLERLGLADNLSAAVGSGEVAYADAMRALAPFAKVLDPGLASAPMGLVIAAHEHLVPADHIPQVESYGRAIFKPSWAKVGWSAKPNEPTSTGILRASLLSFLTLDVHDGAISEQAAKKGRAYAALGKPGFDEKAVSPELAQVALAVAVRDSGPEVFDGLLAKLSTLTDSQQRMRALVALVWTQDPSRQDKALALSLDPSLRANERAIPLWVGVSRPETRERTWTFLQANFDQLAPKLPGPMANMAPRLLSAFCDQAHADQGKAFFTPRLAQYPGAKRSLAQSLERIHSCTAEKAAQAASATDFFRKPPLIH
jgi:alanyl aminopeptidase